MIIAVFGHVGLLHVGLHREGCLAVGVVGGQCGGSVAHQDALQRNAGNRVALIECGIQLIAENILHTGHTTDGDRGVIRILHWVPEHCRDAVVVHGKLGGAIVFAIDGHAGVSKIHELVKGNCDGHILSAGIGSRRGRDALNGGAVRVQQLGGGVAGLDGGGGTQVAAIYLIKVQIQFEGQIVLLIHSVFRGRLQEDADRTAIFNRTVLRFLFAGDGRQSCSIELVLRQTERGIGSRVCRIIIAIRRTASIFLYSGFPVKLDAGVDLVWLIKWVGAAGKHRVAGTLQNPDGIA